MNPGSDCIISNILGMGNCFHTIFVSTFLKSLRNLTVPSDFAIKNDGEAHGESMSLRSTPKFSSLFQEPYLLDILLFFLNI